MAGDRQAAAPCRRIGKPGAPAVPGEAQPKVVAWGGCSHPPAWPRAFKSSRAEPQALGEAVRDVPWLPCFLSVPSTPCRPLWLTLSSPHCVCFCQAEPLRNQLCCGNTDVGSTGSRRHRHHRHHCVTCSFEDPGPASARSSSSGLPGLDLLPPGLTEQATCQALSGGNWKLHRVKK